MAQTEATSPGTVVDDDTVGTVAWADPDNAKVSDDVYAAVTLLDDEVSHYLKATNFGFSIPSGATINGILAEIERKGVNAVDDNAVKIVKSDGSIGTTNKKKEEAWAVEAYFSYGSSSDLWNEVWSAEDINDVDFGVVLAVHSFNLTSYAFVDHIRITVYYTEAPSVVGPFPTFFRP